MVILLAGSGAAAPAAPAGCPPGEWPGERLAALQGEGFAVADGAVRDALALALLPCLGHPDPALRDGVAFEAMASWMRGDGLSAATRREILEDLLPALAPCAADDLGFRAPFAALVLAEVARTDRLEPFLSAAERQRLLTAATEYLTGVRDYRGFDETQGWRHGVAHGADLALQLALHPALGRAELDRLLAAVAAQVAPAGEHSYVHGEGRRLARPVYFVASRGLHSAEEWSDWLARVADPGQLEGQGDATFTLAGLAWRHNTTAFLLALYLNAREGGDPEAEARLVPGLLAAIRSLP